MTWPGAPTIYYGDEAGVAGWTDPDNRRTYPWGHEDRDLIRFYRVMVAIHKKYDTLKVGSLKQLKGAGSVISYGRFTGEEKMVVVLNAGTEEIRVSLPVWEIGVSDNEYMKQMVSSHENGYSLSYRYHKVEEGTFDISVPGHSAMVYIAV